jgi:hypothetical protein
MDLQLLATLIIIGFVISLVIEFSHLENQKYSTRTRTTIYTSSDMRYPTPNVEQVSYTSCTRNEGCRSGGPYVFLYSPNLGFTMENPDRICFFLVYYKEYGPDPIRIFINYRATPKIFSIIYFGKRNQDILY